MWAIGLVLPLLSNIPSARAEASTPDGVAVLCPNLPEAMTAELEARARATLLTSDISATAIISCSSEGVVVQVDAGGDSVTLKVRVRAATLREETLRALDRALADLGSRERVATAGEAETIPSAPSTATPADLSAVKPVAAEPPAAPLADEPATRPPAERATELELAAHVAAETWGHRFALGGGARAAVRFDSSWSCGFRVGALHSFGVREANVKEAHALIEAAVTPRGVLGLRFGLAAGPSLLWASPEAGFASSSTSVRSALRVELQVGRPFRWHQLELTPWIGARAFTAERGLRVGGQQSLVLGGVHPQFGLTLALIH